MRRRRTPFRAPSAPRSAPAPRARGRRPRRGSGVVRRRVALGRGEVVVRPVHRRDARRRLRARALQRALALEVHVRLARVPPRGHEGLADAGGPRVAVARAVLGVVEAPGARVAGRDFVALRVVGVGARDVGEGGDRRARREVVEEIGALGDLPRDARFERGGESGTHHFSDRLKRASSFRPSEMRGERLKRAANV